MRLLTVGYAGRTLPGLVAALRAHRVTHLVDVRTAPVSGRFPDFNRAVLEPFLRGEGFVYVWMGDLLGGRPASPGLYGRDGKLDAALVGETPAFAAGAAALVALGDQALPCMMCAEKDPRVCHRYYINGRLLTAAGHTVEHILSTDTLLAQGAPPPSLF